LITRAAIDLPLGVIIPFVLIVAEKLVNVPPLANIKLLRFNVVVAGTHALPVKSSLLNQLPVVIVGIAVPELINKFGELKTDPEVVPNVYVLVIDASDINPPVTLE
jgi:hypothetical protein